MAAPQIGYPYNVFVAQGEVFEDVKWVKGISGPYIASEGCFSVPHESHMVKRYRRIKVRAGKTTKEYSGYMAQVIQHEFDHIKGKLISDKEKAK
jgi:peptide deformylase